MDGTDVDREEVKWYWYMEQILKLDEQNLKAHYTAIAREYHTQRTGWKSMGMGW